MRKYASMLAVAGGLATVTAACSAPELECSAAEAACAACAACSACAAGEACSACDACAPCATACDACAACEACGACSACGAETTGAVCGAADRVTTAAAECVAAVCVASDDPPQPELSIPPYPEWPPQEASSRIEISHLLTQRDGLSLFDAGQKLRQALNLAGYAEHSFYSIPGASGFVLVTQREQIDTAGAALAGSARFQQPGEGRDQSMLMRLRDLFLERPDSFYRYIAIVVTDKPFGASDATLSAQEATGIVQLGSSVLPSDAREIAFDNRFFAIALIYEFVNEGVGTQLNLIEPGRIAPRAHLERSGLEATLSSTFAEER